MNERVKKDIRLTSNTPVPLYAGSNPYSELEIIIQPGTAQQTGVSVGRSEDGREETLIYYDAAENKLKIDASKSSLLYGRRNLESAPFALKKGEPLTLRVFIDKGIVEVFANDRQAIARAVYPTLGGTGIQLFSKGGNATVSSVKIWDIAPSNPY